MMTKQDRILRIREVAQQILTAAGEVVFAVSRDERFDPDDADYVKQRVEFPYERSIPRMLKTLEDLLDPPCENTCNCRSCRRAARLLEKENMSLFPDVDEDFRDDDDY